MREWPIKVAESTPNTYFKVGLGIRHNEIAILSGPRHVHGIWMCAATAREVANELLRLADQLEGGQRGTD